ncbi:hypothetical protein C8R45DRAFT_1213334 [Mycena sanguinolenta]|nr:hypothetical protein C8R45DRAFT_1213334 [Mycena sanguinolenta]
MNSRSTAQIDASFARCLSSPLQRQTKESFANGWSGEWKAHEKIAKLETFVQVTLPDIWSLPIATPIPFTLAIETDTQKMDHDGDEPVDKAGKSLFPDSPAAPSAVQFYLHRWTHLIPEGQVRKPEDDQELKVSAAGDETTTNVEWVLEVIPEGKKKDEKGGFLRKLKFGHKHEDKKATPPPAHGVWRRTTKLFESTISLPFTPTYSGSLLQWQYQLKFVVPVPGHDDLTLLVPLALIPIHPTPPPGSDAGSADRPPQILGLPPAR